MCVIKFPFRLKLYYENWHTLISCWCGCPLHSITKRHYFFMARRGLSYPGAMLDLGLDESYNVPAGHFLQSP